jgi:hypothetical protein
VVRNVKEKVLEKTQSVRTFIFFAVVHVHACMSDVGGATLAALPASG